MFEVRVVKYVFKNLLYKKKHSTHHRRTQRIYIIYKRLAFFNAYLMKYSKAHNNEIKKKKYLNAHLIFDENPNTRLDMNRFTTWTTSVQVEQGRVNTIPRTPVVHHGWYVYSPIKTTTTDICRTPKRTVVLILNSNRKKKPTNDKNT